MTDLIPSATHANFKSEDDIPEGYELIWSESGTPHLQKKRKEANKDEEDDDAANEHVVKPLPYTVTFDQIEEELKKVDEALETTHACAQIWYRDTSVLAFLDLHYRDKFDSWHSE
jgi:hypothetical protein